MKRLVLLLVSGMVLLHACGGSEQASGGRDETGPEPPRMSAGQKLFVDNCAICHSVKKDKMGPALEGYMSRWNHDTSRVMMFIRNSGEVIRSGDPYATALYQKWNKATMTSFPALSDTDLNELIRYMHEAEGE